MTKRQSKAAEALQEALSSKLQIHALDYSGKLSSTETRVSRGAGTERGFEPGRAAGDARKEGQRRCSVGMDEQVSQAHARAFPYPLGYRQSVQREERRLERRERTWHVGRAEGKPMEQEEEPQVTRRDSHGERRAPPPLPEMLRGRGGPRASRDGSGAPREARAAWRHAGRGARQPSERHRERPEARRDARGERRAPPPLPEMLTLRGGRSGPRIDRLDAGAPRKARAAW